jgi:effector-binding domain-containing protein
MSRMRLVLTIAMAALVGHIMPGDRALAQNAVTTQPIDPFGLEVTLQAKTIIYIEGAANWDSAFEALTGSFKTIEEYLNKEGLKADGPAMTIYTATDDTGFQFKAAVPLAQAPRNPPPNGITIGQSPAGKALKFVHRGSYDAMDNTYEAITNFLDDKQLDAADLFVEEYVTDPLKTAEDKLVINVLVPLK